MRSLGENPTGMELEVNDQLKQAIFELIPISRLRMSQNEGIIHANVLSLRIWQFILVQISLSGTSLKCFSAIGNG